MKVTVNSSTTPTTPREFSWEEVKEKEGLYRKLHTRVSYPVYLLSHGDGDVLYIGRSIVTALPGAHQGCRFVLAEEEVTITLSNKE